MTISKIPYWQRKPSKKVTEWVQNISNLLSDGQVRTVRNITYHFYPGIHGKELDLAYHNIVKYIVRGRAVTHTIKWNSIRESRVKLNAGKGWENTKEFIDYHTKDLADRYSRDKTPSHMKQFEVWFEKDTIEPEFSEVCGKYDVPNMATRGQLTWTAKKKASERLDGDSVILYFGDNDGKGREIFDVICRDLKYLGCGVRVLWAGITGKQELKYGLSPECRLDGVDLEDLKRIVEKAVLRYIDVDKFNAIIRQEGKDIKLLEGLKITVK